MITISEQLFVLFENLDKRKSFQNFKPRNLSVIQFISSKESTYTQKASEK